MISPVQNTAGSRRLGRAADQILPASNSNLISDNKIPRGTLSGFFSTGFVGTPTPKQAFSFVFPSVSVALQQAL